MLNTFTQNTWITQSATLRTLQICWGKHFSMQSVSQKQKKTIFFSVSWDLFKLCRKNVMHCQSDQTHNPTVEAPSTQGPQNYLKYTKSPTFSKSMDTFFLSGEI